MLLFLDGTFMQVIEGEEAAIDETYGRICADHRHRKIFLLGKDPIEQREFASWNMGFRQMTKEDAKNHPAYAPMFALGLPSMRSK
jgi:hypothetical protein